MSMNPHPTHPNVRGRSYAGAMTAARSSEAERLLTLAAEHMLTHGVSQLSLSQLARAIGSNNRMLLYYFDSKEALFAAALRRAYEGMPAEGALLAHLQRPGDLRVQLGEAWRLLRAPENVPYIRLFFEAFGTAVRDPDGNRSQLTDIATVWPGEFQRAFVVHGYPEGEAEAATSRLLALWRGLQFALLEGVDTDTLDDTHDRAVAALFPA
ncbi:TetR/AcrR family transcriptional regulator [Microbacterium lushaniae]|nr:TetR/AcrR family transcriptional regulator [Microbacterium lushaniae]KAA9155074.1 TetR/AcrR family transcriptional regulator [Microbacterium lushaniae]